MKTIIVFSPHPDDLQIAMGGTVLKLIKEGTKVVEVIFSSGHMSNPHLREEIVKGLRRKQTEKVSKLMKIPQTIHLDLEDGNLKEEVSKVENKIKEILNRYKPKAVYIPSLADKHPDHKAVSEKILNLTKGTKIEVLGYDVWGVDDKRYPRTYVDITPYFKQKIRLMRMFEETEWFSIYLQMLPVWLRAKKSGRKIKCKYAERFYKLQ